MCVCTHICGLVGSLKSPGVGHRGIHVHDVCVRLLVLAAFPGFHHIGAFPVHILHKQDNNLFQRSRTLYNLQHGLVLIHPTLTHREESTYTHCKSQWLNTMRHPMNELSQENIGINALLPCCMSKA